MRFLIHSLLLPILTTQTLLLATATSTTPAQSDSITNEPNRWRFGVHYFQGTTNDFAEAITGRWDTIDPNGARVNLSYLIADNLWDLPLDFLVDGGLMWHNEMDIQDDVLQTTLSIKFAWTGFPWNEYLRTRIAICQGLSYASSIPITEQINRGGRSSKNLLNYLEPSISLNVGDFTQLIGLGPKRSNPIYNTWLVGSVPHRSGFLGLYGNDDNGDPITGGSNYLSIGLEMEF